jgi:hypothetical protein
MKKNIKFLMFFIFSLTANAGVMNLPPSVETIDDMVGEFRTVLTNKIIDINKSFIATLSEKAIVYTNSTNFSCNGDDVAQGEPVASLQYNIEKKQNELSEKVVYTGCKGQVSLLEDVVTRGDSLTPISYKDFIRGKRNFDLLDNETYRLYRLSNSDNEEIFKLLIEKKSTNTKYVEMYILGEKFLSLNFNFLDNKTTLALIYSGYKAKYVRKYSTWEFDNQFTPIMNNVIVQKNIIAQVNYLDSNGEQITQNEFLSKFNNRYVNGVAAKLRRILTYHNYYFPTVKAVQSSSLNEHLKEELRIALNRLQNNTDILLVKKQLQEYLDAAESGLIIDNRPKQ